MPPFARCPVQGLANWRSARLSDSNASGGYDLFRGKARCNECHRDGGPGEEHLFTDFTASNFGVPANRSMPYYAEDKPDRQGYGSNPSGCPLFDIGNVQRAADARAINFASRASHPN